MDIIEAQKRAAFARALGFVRPGMRLGLGTSSTTRHFVELFGGASARGPLGDRGTPFGGSRSDARQLRCLTTLDETPELDLTIDGADEIAPDLTMIRAAAERCCAKKSLPRPLPRWW